MNFTEFKRLIGADPWSRDARILRARNSAPEFEQTAIDAENFERKLQTALHVQAPPDLLSEIKDITQLAPQKRNWMPLALAASLLVAVGTVSILWQQSHQWDSVEAYLADHYAADGAGSISLATDSVSAQDIKNIMASLNASAGQQLTGQIRLIKFCPTPNGRGVHMVIATVDGPMTVIFMPETQVQDGKMVEFEQMHAYLLSLEHGSAAIIGRNTQPVQSLEAMVRSSIKTGLIAG